MTYEELQNNPNYYKHHTATHRGYIRKSDVPTPTPYEGRFGKGYTVCLNHPNSSQYHYVAYYIEEVRG